MRSHSSIRLLPAASLSLLLPLAALPAQHGRQDHHHHTHDHASTGSRSGPMTIEQVLDLEHNRGRRRAAMRSDGVSGDGDLAFEVFVRSAALPKQVREPNPFDKRKRSILECAHGGFAFDDRDGKGDVYWFLQGAGILRVHRDRSRIELVETDDAMRKLNMHNATFFEHDGEALIAWPANGGARVFVTDTDGTLVHTMGRPSAPQYAERKPYSPTDTAYLDGLLWVTDGYGSKHVMAYDLTKKAWTDTIFGGRTKKPEPGKFGTNHGITIHRGLLWIAGRYFARIHSYRPDTTFVDMGPLPEGSKPCDFEFFVLGDKLYGVAASLTKSRVADGPGAAIYSVDMANLEVVSTIKPKDELGLDKFVHLHNVFPVVEDGRVTLFCQAWNPGDFAVLRQVEAREQGTDKD